MIARRVRVTGRVQGVFFRAWTREEARALGLAGWVRNRLDGSVEAHVEGDEGAVDRLVERMRDGPPQARVERLHCDEAEPANLGEFEIRR
jgi:acylphosphatase